MGILNRTPDSFYDQGATFGLDDLVRRAGNLVEDGADLLDIGGVKAGPGPAVEEPEELDRVIPAIEAVAARFDIPVSVDTWRASVAKEAYAAGAVVGNDISGFADPEYLPVAAGPAPPWSPPTSGSAPHPRPRAGLRRRGGGGARPSSSTGRPGPAPPVWPPIGSWSTPGSTWARPPTSR